MTVAWMALWAVGLVIPDDKVTDIIILIAGGAVALATGVGWVVRRFFGDRSAPAATASDLTCEAELHTAKLHAALSERHEQVLREHGVRMDSHASRVEAALAQLLDVERQEAVTLATMGPTLTLVMNVLNELPGMWAAYAENLSKIHQELIDLRRSHGKGGTNGYAGGA